MTFGATILRHPLVAQVDDADAGGSDYKYDVILVPGYRFGGWDTHSKFVHSVQHFKDVIYTIEPCPPTCHCKQPSS